MPNLFIESNASEMADALNKLGVDVPAIGQRGIYPTAQKIVQRMKADGSPIEYPVHWDSDLQRKAFFASDGFGAGIPTGRSGAYTDAWSATPLAGGYEITNDVGYAIYISGDEFGHGQSLIHEGRWPLFANVVDEELAGVNEDVEQELVRTAMQDGVEVT
jgi:hypothetical protein